MAHIHHAHDEGSVEKRRAGRLSTQVSVVVNLLLSTIQIVVGALAHSSALIADGVHSLSDLLADFVVLLSDKHRHEAPDHAHRYGHHRYENAASLALSLLLLGVGLGMLYAAAGKFSHPDTIPTVHTSDLWIGRRALVAKELLFR
ncbi:cation-efflux pump, partial [Pseudomonas sp. MWU12-2534b]